MATIRQRAPILSGRGSVSVSLHDAQPPTVPGGVSVAAVVGSTTSLNVSWLASTDAGGLVVSGVAGYRVYSSTTQGGTYVLRSGASPVSALTFTDGGLTAGTTYWYKVAAFDNAGNGSAQSAATSGTTNADLTAPGVPVIAGVTAQSSSSLLVQWGAVTDTGGSGLAGYRVYRSDTQAGSYALRTTTASVSYTDSGLSASTAYWYKVESYDNAGNTSAQSTAASGTTQAGAPAGQWNPQIPSDFVAAYGYLPVIPNVCIYGANQYGGGGRHLGTPLTYVMFVTSLGTGSSGSFDTAERVGYGTWRWCADASLPDGSTARVIIPLVSGLINYAWNPGTGGYQQFVYKRYLTYAGQCGPAPGLYLADIGILDGPSNTGGVDADHVWMHLAVLSDSVQQTNQRALQQTNARKVLYVNGLCAWYADSGFINSANASNPGVNVGYWQCFQMEPIGNWWAAAGGINTGQGIFMDGTASNVAIVRNVIAFAYQRQPLGGIAGNYLYANNLIAGPHGGWRQSDYNTGSGARTNHESNISAYWPGLSSGRPISTYSGGSQLGQTFIGTSGANRNRQLFSTWAETDYGSIGSLITTGRITSAWPAGYVENTIGHAGDGNTSPAKTLAKQLADHAGPFPKSTDRLPAIARVATQIKNRIDETGSNYGAPVPGTGSQLPANVGNLFPSSVAANTFSNPLTTPQAQWGNRVVPSYLTGSRDVPYTSGTFLDGTSKVGYTRLEEFIYEVHCLRMPA